MPKNPETGLPSNSGPENVGEKPEVSKQEISRIEITEDDLKSIKDKLKEYQDKKDFWNGLKLAANLKKLNLGEEIPIDENFLQEAIKYAEDLKNTNSELCCRFVRELRTLKPELEFDLKDSLEKLQKKIEDNITQGKWEDALDLNSILKDLDPEAKNIFIKNQNELKPKIIERKLNRLKAQNSLDGYLKLLSTVKSLNPDFQIDFSKEDAEKIRNYIATVKSSGDWEKYTRLVNQYNEVFGTEISPQSKEESKKTGQGETKTISAEGKTATETTPPHRRVAEEETSPQQQVAEEATAETSSVGPTAETKETKDTKDTKEQKTEQKEKKPQIETPIYLQDPEKKLTRTDIEQNYKEAINAAKKIVEEFKNDFKNIPEEKLLFEIRERIQKVGKYEARGNEDKIYQKLKEISKNPDIFNIPPENILVAFDYLLDQKNKENYLKEKQKFENQISKKEESSETSKPPKPPKRRSLAQIVSLEDDILEVSNRVGIFEKDEKGDVKINEEILPDLKRAEIAYKLLKEYCLDKKTKDRWQDMENEINKLLSQEDKKDKNIRDLLNERLIIEKQLKEAQEKNDTERIKNLQKEYFDISEQLREYDELNQKLLREKYDFNTHLNNVLKNFYFKGKITNEKELEILKKIENAKYLTFEELLEASGVSKEKISETRGITEADKIRKRLEKAGIKEINMQNIEKYALEYLDLLEKRGGFVTMPKEMEFYKYTFVKTPKEAEKYLEKLESKKEIEKLKKEIEQIASKEKESQPEEESQTKNIQEQEPVVQQQSTETKVGQEEKKPEESKKLKGRGRLSFMILWEMIEAFLKGFWNYLKKQKDKFKSILRGFKF